MNSNNSSSSAQQMKLRRKLKLIIPAAGVILAFCSTLALTKCSSKSAIIPWKVSISELDRKAKPHFDQAKRQIPSIAEKLSSLSSLSRMGWYSMTNKAALQKYLTEQLRPLIIPCSKGAAVYGVKMNSNVFHDPTFAVGKDNLRAAAYAVSGLGMEMIFAKTLIRSLGRVIGTITAKMAVSWGGAASCAVADGPLPVGDIVGVILGAGGTVWSAYDLWQCRVRLPIEITAVLTSAVNDIQKQCRQQVR